MTHHITEYLESYHDGALNRHRLRQVEAHLATCETCRSELETLRALRSLLQESPAPRGLTPPDRFVANVGLRLPRRRERTALQKALVWGWRLVPAGLVGAWAFLQAVFVVAGAILVGLSSGLGGSLSANLLQLSGHGGDAWIIGILQRLGTPLSATSRLVLYLIEGIGWALAMYVVPLVIIGLLYWSWLASWWARRQSYRENATLRGGQ